jgi:hypothetical protein
LGGEVVAQGKQQGHTFLAGFGQPPADFFRGLRGEAGTAGTGGVADVQDDIGDGVVVEDPKILRQFQPPGTYRAPAFERQESVIVQVRLEHAAVVDRAAGHYRLRDAQIVNKPVVGFG